MSFVEQLQTKVRHASLKYAVAATTCVGLVFSKDIKGLRGLAPEPFDFFSHAGNVNLSTQFGYLGGLMTGLVVAKKANEAGEAPNPASIRAKMALGGMSVGLLLNGLVETKTGMKLIHWESTADPIDFAYGVVSATAVAGLLPNIEQDPSRVYIASPSEEA